MSSSVILPATVARVGDSWHCSGDWTLNGLATFEAQLTRLIKIRSAQSIGSAPVPTRLDGTAIRHLDTAGAQALLMLCDALRGRGHPMDRIDLHPDHQALVHLVQTRLSALDTSQVPLRQLRGLTQLGHATCHFFNQCRIAMAFLGQTGWALGICLVRPTRLRGPILCAQIQRAGFTALPIVGLLAFLMGVVIAYQGGNQLRSYGANIFIVNLVALTMVRELAPLLTAIIVAGRTGSAYAAQIGTMKITEEIDALRTMGISPFEILVVPKMLGLMIALPLLTVFADLTSIFGGMVVAKLLLAVSFTEFIDRLPQVVSLFSFLFGISKALIFALLIAFVGCYQGFQVQGGADGVGHQTTQSVVQAIFLVMVADAVFAVLWGTYGIY